MLFNTIDYLIFLVTFFIIYWMLLSKNLSLQNLFILVSSYIFYGWWDWRFLSLIFLTTVSSFLAAKQIEKHPKSKKYILWWTLALNFAILIYFKYVGFFLESFEKLAHIFGFEVGYNFGIILLPVGISFYTFQSLSYVIDVYKSDLKASKNFVECAAFIAFFPQLVAGPIERAGNLLLQIQKKRIFDFENARQGLRYILWGLFKKMMVADNCATEVNTIFSNYSDMSSPMLWWGSFLFAIQIYCDFSGYSEIAIGTGHLLGVKFMQNFSFPYFASNIKEFWKRWHISLTNWFKDYVFIPLGGNRKSTILTYRNVFIVFLLSGLWHGANYTYIIWGIYHATLYISYSFFIEKSSLKIPVFISTLLTFLFILIGWVFFRSLTIMEAIDYIKGMFNFNGYYAISLELKSLSGILILLVVEWYSRNRSFGLDINHWKNYTMRWIAYSFLIIILLAYGSFNAQTFIYFNF
jgi:alginate O-acetyltransferase complex protein AlgI